MLCTLAVDDSASMRSLVTPAREQAGFDVVVAKDRKEAPNHAQQNDVDFVLTDLDMPSLDSFDLIKKLHEFPHHKFVLMLALTTEPDTGRN